MEWLQVFSIMATTIGCCLFFRRETKAQLDALAQHGRERDQEMKDFHGKMCTLEERYIQLMQRILEGKK